jgi:hypothetical protein
MFRSNAVKLGHVGNERGKAKLAVAAANTVKANRIVSRVSGNDE